VDDQIERLVGLVGGRAFAVSADGAVIGGYRQLVGPDRPFRWENGTFVGLDGLIGPMSEARVWGMTPDATILLGEADTASGTEAVRWVNGVIESLGDLPGGPVSAAAYVSNADGSLIGGRGYDGTLGRNAFIWDRMNGMRELKAVLEQDFGLDLGDWEFDSVWGISDDGSVLTGYGDSPNAGQQAWVVVVPEPSASLMIPIGVGLLAVLARLRRAALIL
jgi:probable HAF family extracellular repeat protein